MEQLDGKVAIVTGGSSGIGRAIAVRLAHDGAEVHITGRSAEALETTVAAAGDAGGRVHSAILDVRDTAAFEEFIDGVAGQHGRLDILVNNAGVGHLGGVLEQGVDEWAEMLEVNVLAVLVGAKRAITHMRATAGAGHIVNISSIATHRRDSGVYGATKHAVNVISASLYDELQAEDINVVTVMPGAYATNFARHMTPEAIATLAALGGVEVAHTQGEKVPEELLDRVADLLPRVLGNPTAVADAVAFAVTQPPTVNINEITVRPPQALPDMG